MRSIGNDSGNHPVLARARFGRRRSARRPAGLLAAGLVVGCAGFGACAPCSTDGAHVLVPRIGDGRSLNEIAMNPLERARARALLGESNGIDALADVPEPRASPGSPR